VVLFRFGYGSRFPRTIWRRTFAINDVQDAPRKRAKDRGQYREAAGTFEAKDLMIARQK
jgi:hypothetical protein